MSKYQGYVSAWGKLAFGTALAAIVTGAAAAQTSAEVREREVVVVTAAAVPIEFEKVGNSISVFTSEQLEDGGYNYVSDALRQIPGLAVSRTGPFGGLTAVRIRGAEGNHTLVLLDGVDISAAGSGETDLDAAFR